jgi:hypothetical protein
VTATLLAAGLAAANLSGISEARASKVDREVQKFLLQTFERQPDAVLATLNMPSVVRANAPYLRDRRLGPFADPQELLIPAPGSDAPEAVALVPGRTISQSFTSPLDVVHDVAVELGADAPDERTRITMTLAAGGATIARTTFGAEELSPHGWLRLPLAEPLVNARGRTFTVILTAEPGAGPVSTVAVATRAPYYEGALRVADSPLPGRALGLALDAIRLRVVR